MATGRVKFYNENKGYGFIIIDDEGKELFVHQSEIKTADETLKKGQKVKFKVGKGPKGIHAVKVSSC